MSDLMDSSVVTTRKEHQCEYCGGIIPAKTEGVLYESGKYQGKWFRRYCCPTCYPFIYQFWDDMDGECSEPIWDCFEEWVRTSGIHHPTMTVDVFCPSCNQQSYSWADTTDGDLECVKCGYIFLGTYTG